MTHTQEQLKRSVEELNEKFPTQEKPVGVSEFRKGFADGYNKALVEVKSYLPSFQLTLLEAVAMDMGEEESKGLSGLEFKSVVQYLIRKVISELK